MCNVRSKIARNDNIADLIIFVRCFFIWKTGCISNVITENFCGKGKEIRVGKTGLNVPKMCIRDRFPDFMSTLIYRFDMNLRDATVLGLVGAGGIGAPLIFAMSAYKWNQV